MKKPSLDAVWRMNDAELLGLLDSGALMPQPRRIRFYAPSFMHYKTSQYCSSATDFPTISVTGQQCALQCRHCGGIVLNTMHPATTPEKLIEVCTELKEKGAVGCLISGGCLPSGSVPLDKFAEAIEQIKRELGLTVFVHTGIIDYETARTLKKARVDAALIDIIGSDETIREIYNMNVTVKDYEESLEALKKADLVFVPHVIVGLDYGKLKGEMHALEMVSKHDPSALVIIAFMPIHGTEMQNIQPPKPLEIAKVLATARLMLPTTPLVLGCMRPRGTHRTETDILATKAGVNAIAFPAEEAIEYAETHNYEVAFSPICCAQIYSDLKGLSPSNV
jgi:uncharacterized radical SAM superfamily protein